MSIFTFNDGGEIELSPEQVQQIAESYSWPYEWEVATKLKEQRDAYKAQLDQAVEALKGLGVYAGNEWCFCHYDPGTEPPEKCWDARRAIPATEDE